MYPSLSQQHVCTDTAVTVLYYFNVKSDGYCLYNWFLSYSYTNIYANLQSQNITRLNTLLQHSIDLQSA